MKFCQIILILMGINSLCLASDAIITIIPTPQEVEFKNEILILSNDWSILLDKANEEDSFAARYLQDRINKQFGLLLGIEDIKHPYKKNHILLGKIGDPRLKEFINVDEKSTSFEKIGDEGYILDTSSNCVAILAKTSKGIFYGVVTLRQLIKEKENKILIHSAKIVDYPKIKIRAVHFSGVKPDKIKEELDKIAQLKYNTAIIESQAYFNLNRGENRRLMEEIFDFAREHYIEPIPEILSFSSAEGILVKDPYAVEGIPIENEPFIFINNIAKSIKPSEHSLVNVIRDEENEIIVKSKDQERTYIEGRDYKVISERIFYPFKLNTIPTQILRTPDSQIKDGEEVLISYTYYENKTSYNYPDCTTPYCPSTERTYKIMFEVIENVIEILRPSYMSIGHDEIRGMNRDNRCRKRNLGNAELLAEDINRLYDISKSVDPDIKILMWSDMLNPYNNGGNVNFQLQYDGPSGGTFLAIDLIPKDIVLMIAAYEPNKAFSIRSCDFFDSKQFKYFVAGWNKKENISDWAKIAKLKTNCLGIIDTTWYDWEGNIDVIKYTAEVSWH